MRFRTKSTRHSGNNQNIRSLSEKLEMRRLLAAVSGTVFKDVNYNGVRDTGDTPLAGYTVNIYTGASNSSVTLFETVTTDSSGAYSANNLPANVAAEVQVAPTPGFVWADISGSFWSTGNMDLTQNFLLSDRSIFRGYVFNDANGNGIRDTNEQMAGAGTRGYLDVNNDNIFENGEPSGVTAASGIFYIGGINPGTYVIRLLPADGYTQTAPAGKTITLTFGSSPVNQGDFSSFGIQNNIAASTITGYSFNDVNGDGVYQAATETHNAGRTIYIDANGNGKLDSGELSAFTDATGLFTLHPQNLTTSSSVYTIHEVLPSGYTVSSPNVGTSVAGAYSVSIAPGASIALGNVFGSVSQSYSVSGLAFYDTDGHGVYDAGVDLPLPEQTVYADTNYDGRYTTGEPTALTDLTGHYTLVLSTPGNYSISLLLTNGGKKSRPPNFSGSSPYADLTTASPTATIDLGYRLPNDTIAIDSSPGLWTATSQPDDAGSGNVIPLSDGSWLVRTSVYSVGYLRDTIRHFKTNGLLDGTFGVNGILTLSPGEGSVVYQQKDGKLLVAGSTFGPQYGIVRRYTANGQLDTSFGTSGVVSNFNGLSQPEFIGNISVASDGSILIASRRQTGTTPNFVYTPIVTKLSASGVRQTSFGVNGNFFDSTTTNYPFGTKTDLAADGGIVMFSDNNRILKLLPSGGIDTSFGNGGVLSIAYSNAYIGTDSVRVQADGKLLIVGGVNGRAFLGRFNADGTADTTFGSNGLSLMTQQATHPGVNTSDDFADVLQLDDGGYLVVGSGPGATEVSDLLLVRFNANGSLNTSTFANGRGTYALSPGNDAGTQIAAESDGRILIGATTLDGHGASVIHLPAITAAIPGSLTVVQGASLGITARASVTGGSIKSYTWDFNYDGKTFDTDGTGATVTFNAGKITGPATRTIALLVTDANGFTKLVTQTIQITAPTTTTTLQAEDATLSGGTAKATNHAGYTGTGFADYGGNNSAVQFSYNAAAAGAATLSFRYSNGGSTARPLTVSVNGTVVGTISGSPTANWDTWGTYTLSGVNLVAGVNTIKAVAGTATGGNLDSLAITASGTAGGGTTNPTTFTPIHIDSGGGASGSYTADGSFSGGSTYSSTAAIDTSAVSSPAPQAVYQTERFGNFAYNLAGLTAGKQYTVTLHFDELYWTAAGKRVFNVAGNGTSWLSNFDVYAAAGAKNKAITRSFTIAADSNGKIAIVFTSIKDNAKVNAIDVVEASGTTTPTQPTDPTTPTTTATYINAGGGASGSYVADTGYSGGSVYSTSSAIVTTGVTNPAPQSVYQTERYGNFTYTLSGFTAGAQYNVSLDFAENYFSAAGQRLFNVLINGSTVASSFDIYAAAGGRYRAVRETYRATADSSGKISIQFVSVKDNAKVNGISVVSA